MLKLLHNLDNDEERVRGMQHTPTHTCEPLCCLNRALEAAYADLRKQLEAEYAKQAKAIDFKIPDFADKPGEANEGPKKKPGKKKKAK